ncbi:hypothetical protein Pcinc_009539 [Petrolisthes cinctipes]|uniref:Uncharacterized protein n=1 Tax=Petrolisthes cinctipes TaxID=88211 RepID=A0AAE1G6P3_PETCI|nr:hypothetical protein Pcinc_009539 [Petrolisthes cinctipes]
MTYRASQVVTSRNLPAVGRASSIIMGWIRVSNQHNTPPRVNLNGHRKVFTPGIRCILHTLCHWYHTLNADIICRISTCVYFRTYGGE